MNKHLPSETKGSVLIIALWALFLLTTFALHLGAIIRQKITLATRLDARDKLFFIAEAGVKTAVAEVRKEDELAGADCLYESWGNSPVHFREIPVDKGDFTVGYRYLEEGALKERYGMMDEETKININTADADTLMRLLQKVAGLNADEAMQTAYAIVDWRDNDSFYQHPHYGAEDADYEDLPTPYEAKDSDFEVVDELLLVKGINGDIFGRLHDFVTVYGGGQININTATAVVLDVLGLTEKTIEGLQNFRRGADGLEGTPDDGVFMSPDEIIARLAESSVLTADDEALLRNGIDHNLFSVKSGYFRVKSLARLNGANGPSLEIIAVIDRSGYIHYWREYF
jgi:type II secretory pathway component PulK